jgi:hypothetical protein
MLPVAALLAGESRNATSAAWIALVLALTGAALMLLFQAVGGRVPQDIGDPLIQTVWPVWAGQDPLPSWRMKERFARNLVSLVASGWIDRLSPRWQFSQFVPLGLAQFTAIAGLWRFGCSRSDQRMT